MTSTTKVKRRKKVCPKCGRKLWLKEFYKRSDGYYSSYCRECERKYRIERYDRNERRPQGVYLRNDGRLSEVKNGHAYIYWTENMLSIMQRFYPNTKNEEISEMLGLCVRSIQRKARKMGLNKTAEFLTEAGKNAQIQRTESKHYFYGNQYTGKLPEPIKRTKNDKGNRTKDIGV